MKLELTPRGLLTVFFRQKAKFLTVFIIVLTIGIDFILLSTPQYESTGSLLVKFGNSARPEITAPEHQVNQPDISQTGHEVIESYVGMLESNNLLLKLLEEFGPDRIYPKLAREDLTRTQRIEAAMKKLRHDLTIKSSQESDIIDISLLNSDPKLAAQMVQRLQQHFISLQTELYNQSQTSFISQQARQAAQRLADDQAKLQAFKVKVGISTIDTEESALLEEKNSVKTTTLETSLESVNAAQANLDALKAKENYLLTTYREDSAPVVQARQNVAFAENQLNERKQAVAASTVRTGPGDIKRRIAFLESERSEYNDLSRQVQMDADSYKNYLTRLESAKLNDRLNQQNITRVAILDTPIIAAKPLKPAKLLILVFSVLAAAVFGLGAVLMAETMDERFSSQNQLSSLLNVPVFAIPAMVWNKSAILPPRRTGGALVGKTSPALPSGMLMELYNQIKSGLSNKPSHIIQFISTYAHEGASPIAFDMAAIVANRTPLRVLFVDTSNELQGIRRPLAGAVNAMPDMSYRSASSPVEASTAVAIGTNLAYTTLHNRDHNSDSAFSEPQTVSALLETWRKIYDLVVISSPAIMTDVAHKTLTRLTDGCVFIVEAERTRAPVVAQVQNMVLSGGGRILCAILNKRNFYVPGWLYRKLWL